MNQDLCEGLISLEEYSKIINSFPLNKVPGNDGLPIEFYMNASMHLLYKEK